MKPSQGAFDGHQVVENNGADLARQRGVVEKNVTDYERELAVKRPS